jgi:3-mercaptopyruvate sulfurtransferase SseA
MNNTVIAIMAVILLGSAAIGFTDSELDGAPRIGLEEFKSQHAENSVYVIDVRYPREYESGHIPGAVLIPLELLNSKLSELSRLTKPIITYCH